MSPPKALTPEQVQEAVQMYKAGKSSKEIGDRFYVHQTTVARYLREEGVKMRPSRYPVRHLEAEDLLKTTQLAGQGFSTREIGRILGIHQTTVVARLKKYAR